MRYVAVGGCKKPFVFHRKEDRSDGVCLLFDFTTTGCRAALQWIDEKWDKKEKLFRAAYPYSNEHDTMEEHFYWKWYGEKKEDDESIVVTDTIDCFPDDYDFEIVPIEIDDENKNVESWPRSPNHNKKMNYSDLKLCVTESERRLTHPLEYEGLTEIQLEAIRVVEKEEKLRLHEIVSKCASKHRFSSLKTLEQIEKLFLGPLPVLKKVEGGVVKKNREEKEEEDEHLLPRLLIDGPFPMNPKKLAGMIIELMDTGRITEIVMPERDGHVFVRELDGSWTSVPKRTDDGLVVVGLPYGMDKKTYLSKGGTDESSFSRTRILNGSDCSIPIEQKFVVISENQKLVTHTSVESYLKRWLILKCSKLCMEKASKTKRNKIDRIVKKFVRKIYVCEKFDDDTKRVFLDETKERKKRRVESFVEEEDEEDDDIIVSAEDEIMNFPLSRLGPDWILREDDDDNNGINKFWCGRDELKSRLTERYFL